MGSTMEMKLRFKNSKKNSVSSMGLYLIGLLSTFVLIKLFNQPIAVIIMFPLVALLIVQSNRKIFVRQIYILYAVILFMGIALAAIYGMKYTYITFLAVVIVCVTFLFAGCMEKAQNVEIYKFLSGFKMSCVVQLIWCILQFLFSRIFAMDINRIVFCDFLKIVDRGNVSRYGNGILRLSGISAHPASMIPVIIFSWYLLDRWYVKLICIFVATYSANSTMILAVLLCLAEMLMKFILERFKGRRISRKSFVRIFFVLLAALVFSITTGIIFDFMEKVIFFVKRIMDLDTTYSSYIHARYYYAIMDVWKFTDIPRILFGYGKGCSGYPFSVLYSQYTSLLSWNVESNLMDAVYGTGIIGTIIYYFWFFENMVRGYKVDYRYSCVFGILFICGLFYDNQFAWVLFVEVVLSCFIHRKTNIFVEH